MLIVVKGNNPRVSLITLTVLAQTGEVGNSHSPCFHGEITEKSGMWPELGHPVGLLGSHPKRYWGQNYSALSTLRYVDLPKQRTQAQVPGTAALRFQSCELQTQWMTRLHPFPLQGIAGKGHTVKPSCMHVGHRVPGVCK